MGLIRIVLNKIGRWVKVEELWLDIFREERFFGGEGR